MNTKLTCLCMFACFTLIAGADVVNAPLELQSNTTVAPIPSTTLAPTTTAAPTSPPPPPTTTTVAPTTPPAPTTTVAPTTPPPPKTTTIAPTTPPAPPTTTPGPVSTTPVPAPSAGTWSVTDTTTNKTCIIAKMAVQLNVSYVANNKTMTYLLDIPADNKTVTVTGSCGNTTQIIKLKWGAVPFEFNVEFEKNGTTKHFDVNTISLKMNTSVLPDIVNGTSVVVEHVGDLFSTSLDMSYKCKKQQTINLTMPTDNTTFVTVTVSDVQVQAFKNDTSTGFANAEDCESSGTPDIIPIAVGCALAALVIVVLIAYLLGRRRIETRGYYSIGEDQSD